MAETHFGEAVAARYDEDSASMFDPDVLDPTVTLLGELADGGAAVEFGIGTGRVALPLASRGVRVHGIDNSPFMIDRLRAKAEADDIECTLGDFATTRVDGSFRLVYLVFNTIMNLTTQDDQVACFENAAAHLEPGGSFVVEVVVPDLRRLPPGERFVAFAIDTQHAGVDEYADIPTQTMYSHHYSLDGIRSEAVSVPFRFVWPSELDLMARIAGLTLAWRWSDWERRPFTGESRSHVSVWQKRT